MELFDYQKVGVEFLANRKRAMLADDPGLGKTVQVIKACDAVNARSVLIVCPASVVGVWKREIGIHRVANWEYRVTSFEKATGADNAQLLAGKYDVLVIDEAHFLKSYKAKRTHAIYGKSCRGAAGSIVSRADRVWVLSGTPMPNNSTELWTHLHALAPETIIARHGRPYTFFEFMLRYCRTMETGFGKKIIGSMREEELHEKLSKFMLRRRKKDVALQLPPLTFDTLEVEAKLDSNFTEEAEDIRKALEEEGVAGLRRLRVDGGVSALRRHTGLCKIEACARWVKDWLEANPDRKIVVFAHHTDVIEGLYDRLHVHSVRLSGATKAIDRDRAVAKLQNDPLVRCFIGQITAAGVGITLTKASDLLFVESSWVPAEMEQAAQRIHRIGQTEPCNVMFALIPGSIDEQIQWAVARKVATIEMVVDGEL